MEKNFKISTSGNKKIYGVLRGSLRDPLIVLVHGFTGDMNEHQFFNFAPYLERYGFSSFRFRLYSYHKDARKLHECTLGTHASDLDRVIRYFRKKGVKKIFVVGHSYGGKIIFMSKDRDFNGIIFWDPSHRYYRLFKKVLRLKQLHAHLEIEDTPYWVLVGDKMVQEEKVSKVEERIRDLKIPIKIICAGKGVLVRGGRWYYQNANNPKKLIIIKNATHCFDEEGVEEKLFQETVGWIKKFV